MRVRDGDGGLLPLTSSGGIPDDPGMEEFCEVVVTADDAEWLAGFTRTLVEERLAACGHLVQPIRSIYRWDGAVQDEAEARVALHTRRDLVDAIVARARELHPYEVPCVIALPLAGGHPDYLAWITRETHSDRAGSGDAPSNPV